jgi:excisionase family DNA binding protein
MKTQVHAATNQLVSPEVIATRLNVSRNTVLNWARDGKIPCIRIGKIYRFSMKKISEAVGYALEES